MSNKNFIQFTAGRFLCAVAAALTMGSAIVGSVGCSRAGNDDSAIGLIEKAEDLNAGDADLEFIRSVCVNGLEDATKINQDEIHLFCGCVVERISPQLNSMHRASVREGKRYLASNKAPPAELFEKSGLKQLISESQDLCADQLWSAPAPVSEVEHKRLNALANKSVEDFVEALDSACPIDAPSSGRDACLKAASAAWIANHGSQYEEIPEQYISGIDLAEDLLRN